MNMLDMLRAAQGGSGIENLARQFGLAPAETESVLKSVLPAVSAGFKQKTRDEGGLASILKSIQGTSYEDVFDNADAIRRDDISARGNDVLGQIFGSKEISREVARKTEQSSGVAAGVVKKMLPVIASMVLGGMQKRTTSNNDMGGALGGLVSGLLGSKSAPRPSSGGGGLDDILGSILGQHPQRQPQPAPQPRSGGGGLGGILGGLLRGRRSQPAPQPRQQPRHQPQARGGDSLDDLLGGIFGSAPKQRRSTGDANIDGVIGMFDSNGDGEVDIDILRQLARRR